MRWSCSVTLLVLVAGIDAARILVVIPTSSISHQVVFRPLTQELAKRGHEVTVITTDPVFTKENRPENLIEIDVHNISYSYFLSKVQLFYEMFGKRDRLSDFVIEFWNFTNELFEIQLKSTEVQTLIKNTDKNYFDLLFIEAGGKSYVLYSHLFNAPLILGSSLGLTVGSAEVASPSHPLLYPLFFRQQLFNLTFWDTLNELYHHFNFHKVWYDEPNDRFVKYFAEDLPSYGELYNNVDSLFINIHPLLDSRRPLPPNVIAMWGIHKRQEKPLPQDLQKYLDSSENGVIYLSFGSNVLSSILPQETIQLLLNVFSKLPYNILWKWETDELPGKTENIKIAPWLPQSDLLKHPNVKLFITQGGLQSLDETIDAGVPLVGIPMLADQWYNIEMCEYYKIGAGVHMETITEEKLSNAIHTVISDESYGHNIKRLRSLLNDQRETPLERAVYWIEYSLQHGLKHLRAAAVKSSYEYYEVELVISVAAVAITLSVVVFTALHTLYVYLLKKLKFLFKVT